MPQNNIEEKFHFSIHSHFTEEEYKRIVYATRENERHKRAIIMLIAAVLCTVIGLCIDNLRMVFFALFIVVCIAYNYINPLMFTNKHIKAVKEKHGNAELVTDCYFTDDGVKVLFKLWNVATYPEYGEITRLYVKDGWLFFCAENSRGFYVKSSAVEDVNELVSFVKEKNAEIKILK